MIHDDGEHARRQAQLWDLWAESYDDWHASNSPHEAAEFLIKHLPDSGRILELGVGTGRVATEIARRGHPIEGLDISEAMLAQLTSKATDIPLTAYHGDMANIPVAGPFGLIYCTSSSFFHLADQQRQVDCFRSVSDHLAPDGRFILEAFIPTPELLSPARTMTLRDFTPSSLRFSATVVNRYTQQIRFQEATLRPEGIEFLPVEERFCWPSELDLMAQLADLELEQRYASYTYEPINHKSPQHVSIYRRQTRAAGRNRTS
ncbi:methyltransferase domain-containing protein [Nocardia uniformis]|uniref:Methyltransferase domain-containing protein n=1 Tax=Nocardia uniformis TaxID=53432 RepID=A0A849BV17_9NOCA|nr:class I SAM-dependent methyltransferase [Nocardia uniformis]NNH68746.1 methyltransferase domain-containing protein [Nocardia uniformis]